MDWTYFILKSLNVFLLVETFFKEDKLLNSLKEY